MTQFVELMRKGCLSQHHPMMNYVYIVLFSHLAKIHITIYR